MTAHDDQLFHVSPGLVNQTLAAALRKWLPGKSWGHVRKIIAARRVTINGNTCLDPARRLKVGEPVKLLTSSAAKTPKHEDVRIRFLDSHLVIVEKPAGITTLRHPEERYLPSRRRQLQPTLDEVLPGVVARHEGLRRSGKSQPRLRAVHRLDRDTSGLMVFARTVQTERLLGRLFRKHDVERIYQAIVEGHPEQQTIETRLVRDRGDGRRGSSPLPNQGKTAITHIRPMEVMSNHSLVECRLETGRTHQIRIHLAELGCPLCGEKVYRKRVDGSIMPDLSGIKRAALHAAHLGLDHPITGVSLSFAMPMPMDMKTLLARLREPIQ